MILLAVLLWLSAGLAGGLIIYRKCHADLHLDPVFRGAFRFWFVAALLGGASLFGVLALAISLIRKPEDL